MIDERRGIANFMVSIPVMVPDSFLHQNRLLADGSDLTQSKDATVNDGRLCYLCCHVRRPLSAKLIYLISLFLSDTLIKTQIVCNRI
jgi:hypothetical protein